MIDIDKLRALEQKATPGPWSSRPTENVTGAIDTPRGMFSVICAGIPNANEWTATKDLICHVRNVLPELLDELQRLRAIARQNW